MCGGSVLFIVVSVCIFVRFQFSYAVDWSRRVGVKNEIA